MRRYPNLSAALLLGLIVIGFYCPVVFFGKSLLSSLYYPRGVTNDGPYGYSGRKPVNTFNVELSSAAYYEAPLNHLVGHLYRQGALPLWNPYQAAGMPLAAQYSSRAFFPYQIAENLSPVWAWDFFMLGRPWLAGFLTFLFLIQLGVSRQGAFLGGVFYMLSGTMVWWINFEQMTNVAMVTPLLFLCLKRQFLFQRSRDLALSAATFALVLLAGQPEVALYVLLLAGSYALLLAWLGVEGLVARLRALCGVVVAFVLGLALSAPLIVPFLEGMREMVSIHPADAQMGVRDPLPWRYLLGIIMPTIFEYPIAHRQLPDNGMWDFLGAYVGVTPLFLMVVGLGLSPFRRASPHRAPLAFFGAFGVGLLLKHHGWTPFLWIGHLPLFDITWSQRWGAPMWTFSLAVAGAMGWEIIREAMREPAGATSSPGRARNFWPARVPLAAARIQTLGTVPIPAIVRILLAAGAVLLFALLTILIANNVSTYTRGAIEWLERPPANPPLQQEAAYFWPSVALSVGVGLLTLIGLTWLTVAHSHRATRWCLGVVAFALTELWFAIPRGYPPAWASLEAVPVTLGFLAAAACFRERWRLAATAAGAALLSFVVLDYNAPSGFPDRFDPFTPAPYVEFLKRQPGHHRMVGSGVLMPNFASALGVLDLRYVAALSVKSIQAYRAEFLHAYPLWRASGDVLWFNGQPFISVRVFINNTERVGRLPQPFAADFRARLRHYSFLGVKYVVVPKGEDLNESPARGAGGRRVRFPLVYEGEVRIYENPAVLPRAFIAGQLAYAPTYEEAQQVSSVPTFDLRNRVVLEEPAPDGYEPPRLRVDGGAVEITRYEPSKVTVEARSAPAGVLVLTDVFYPGWRARVDGQPAKIYRVNGVVRGVFIPSGTHIVEFSYFPGTFLVGLISAAAAVLVCVALLLRSCASGQGGSPPHR